MPKSHQQDNDGNNANLESLAGSQDQTRMTMPYVVNPDHSEAIEAAREIPDLEKELVPLLSDLPNFLADEGNKGTPRE